MNDLEAQINLEALKSKTIVKRNESSSSISEIFSQSDIINMTGSSKDNTYRSTIKHSSINLKRGPNSSNFLKFPSLNQRRSSSIQKSDSFGNDFF